MAGLGRPGPGPRAALPAWKREILERKRAKLAALGGGAAPETRAEAGAAEPSEPAAEPSEPAAERHVLAESLGPLRENPFMRLESERRRGTRRGGGEGPAGARRVQQLLELYRRVPGVRTIHADNILIIESAPGFPPAGPGPGPGPAARIRAAEVVVYEAPPPPGRVSRLLQKFDAPAAPVRRGSPERGRTPPPQPQPAPGPAAPRVGERAASLELERRGTGPGAQRSDFLQKTGSNSFTVHPRGLHRSAGPRPLPNEPADPESRAGAANGLAGSAPGLGEQKPKVESGEPPVHPPPSPATPSATPAASLALPTPNPASATPSQRQWVSAATSANDSFEIRPASKPDMDRIPAGDLQARALANLRVNSRNSFVFIPKRKDSGAPPPEVRQAGGLPEREVGWASQRLELEAQLVPGRDSVPAGGGSPLGVEEGACPRPATALVDQAVRRQRLSSPSLCALPAAEAKPAQGLGVPSLAKNGGVPGRPGLPVTFIDEVDLEDEVPQEAKPPCSGAGGPPWYHLHPTGPGHPSGLQHRGGNTFTVVPKRKPGSLQANGEPGPQEAEDEEAGSLSESPATLGTTLKKRYPTVHEIEVIGGYLALEKSCLTKAGSSRKKMKISFNDKRLQTTFEYPPESSLVQEEEAEAQEEAAEESSSDGVLEKPFALFLPRATFVNSVGPESPRLRDGSSGECPPAGVGGPVGKLGRTSTLVPLGPQACPATLQSTLWPLINGRSRRWSRRRVRYSPHQRKSCSPLPVRTTSQTSAVSQLSISDPSPARMAKAEPWESGSAQEPCLPSAPLFCPTRLCPAISHPPFLGPHNCTCAQPEPRALGAPASLGAESCSPALIWGHCLWRTHKVLLDTMPSTCVMCVKG